MESTLTSGPGLQPGADLSPLIGQSPAMQTLRRAIARVAASQAPLLVTGETGAGKELVARHVHQASAWREGPFLVVHAALAGPEFFRAGRPESFGQPASSSIAGAHRGCLFLDSVEELSLPAQAELLHFLSDQGAGGLPAGRDLRVIASSHVDLDQLARRGSFRLDLLHWLAALRVEVPALRDRGSDVSDLSAHFLAHLAQGRRLQLDPAAEVALASHDWPGNVRELRNRIGQAELMTEDGWLSPELLGLVPRAVREGVVSLREMRQSAEREAITRALRESRGQVPAAAAALGISRAQLYRLISRLHMDTHAAAAESGRDTRITLAT